MAGEIEIEVSLTRADIARYNFHHIRWLLVLDALGLIGLLTITYISLFHPSPETRDLFGSLIIWGILLVAVGLSQPVVLLLQIFVMKNAALAGQTVRRVYTFADDGIHIESQGRLATTSWSKVTVLKDIGRLILIFTGSGLAYVIPGRCLATNEAKKSLVRYLRERMERAP